MKIQLRNITICSRRRLRKKIEKSENINVKRLYYFKGVIDSHWFCICIYRNNIN